MIGYADGVGNTHAMLDAALQQQATDATETSEHVMVCISSSPLSSKLIRTSYKLAQDIKAQWTAVYVETSHAMGKDEERQKQLIQNMHLVENLGGKVVTLNGESVADAITHYAKRHQVTKIVVGYPTQFRWYNFSHQTIIDRLIQQNDDIDIYVINSGEPVETFTDFVSAQNAIQPGKYILTFVLIAATTLIDIFINPFVFPATLVTLYFIGIAAAAVYLGYRSALFATMLSVTSFFFFFVPHTVDEPIGSLPYIAIMIGMLVTGFILTRFITQAIDRSRNANRRADQMMELYSLSRDLATTITLEGIVETITMHVKYTFQADACIYLNEAHGLELYQKVANFPGKPIEEKAAQNAFEVGQMSGANTPVHSQAQALYIPLRTAHQKVGVLGMARVECKTLTLDQHRLIDAFATQAALAIEASRLVEQAHEARLAKERERLQSALLDSISHDLRTPLVSITGALSSLRDEAALYDEDIRIELLNDAWLETDRLNRLVENLLEMSRLQSGKLNLNSDWHDPDEIIAVARSQLRERLRPYRIMTHVQQDISLIYVDFTLMVQVIVNLLDNAAKYASDNKTIEICTLSRHSSIVFQIADCGVGIPEADLPMIFDKFYRATNTQGINGTGLGLSICAGIVEAHNGAIRAFNRPEGGAIFEVELPVKDRQL